MAPKSLPVRFLESPAPCLASAWLALYIVGLHDAKLASFTVDLDFTLVGYFVMASWMLADFRRMKTVFYAFSLAAFALSGSVMILFGLAAASIALIWKLIDKWIRYEMKDKRTEYSTLYQAFGSRLSSAQTTEDSSTTSSTAAVLSGSCWSPKSGVSGGSSNGCSLPDFSCAEPVNT
eukprot:CAMPEP_0171511530 /NCGR_PEP_ID=MMETSP0959-20130129/1042_1 /TAXON_ID=87120 /ORGANISM="Aurantiochytrium limacinum, Strain ATCCMYA-1381" /LENGTH=176 /DNA_ID=CAMNT_0012049159 /DNA_START=740 /DNA_END=1270 /DNA_ORIENTATION=-